MKRLLALLVGLTAALAFCADIPVITNGPGGTTFSGTGVVVQTRLQGQSSISVSNTGGSGNTVTVQASNDNSTWQSVGTVTTAQGTQTFTIGSSNSGLLYLRFNVTAFGSGPGTLIYTASATVQGSSSSGGTVAVSSIPPITIAAPTDGNGNVKVAAQNTISPIPAATATAGAAAPASAIPVMAIEHCIHQNGLAAPAPTAGNVAVLLCDDLDRLMINTTDPSITIVKSGSVATATTTLLVAGVNNKRVYIYGSFWQSTGTNSTNTVQWEYGQGATCATNTFTILPAPVAPGTATGEWIVGWGGSAFGNATVTGLPPVNSIPLPLPLNATGYGWCGVTAGTTTLGNFVTVSAVHDY